MGKGADSGIKPRDIERIAESQARWNRTNQVTPTGSLSWSGNTANVTLSPAQQALLEQQEINQLLAGQTAGARFGDLGTGRADVEQATFDRAMSLLAPEYERQERGLQQRLANTGLPATSGAYDREFSRFERGRNEALERLAMSSVVAGGQEESRAIQAILALLGGGAAASPQFMNPPPITIPVNQPGGGANPALGFLGGAGMGASSMAATGNPWAIAGGAGLGGLLGLAAA